jgi:hypothetical protein
MLRRTVGVIGLVTTLALMSGGAAGQTPAGRQAPVIPPGATELEGVPAVRLDATPEGTIRRQLDAEEAKKESLKVKVVDGQFFWASRENRPLTLRSTGEFTYLSSATEPGRYVRLRRIDDRIQYVEHVDMAVGSVTYWGELRIILGR